MDAEISEAIAEAARDEKVRERDFPFSCQTEAHQASQAYVPRAGFESGISYVDRGVRQGFFVKVFLCSLNVVMGDFIIIQYSSRKNNVNDSF